MNIGTIVKNGTSTFIVLATEEDKALLYRQSDGETLIAVNYKETGKDENDTPIIEWGHGIYYGNYMNKVLHILENLKHRSIQEPVYVKTSQERAAFLESFGDKIYESGLQIFTETEAMLRANNFIPDIFPEATEEQITEIYECVAEQLYAYLKDNENALNYDELDDITSETITDYVTEHDCDELEDNYIEQE